MNAIMSPIPTRVYKPATVTPRQTSAMTLSGSSLICLRDTALLRAIVQPKQITQEMGNRSVRCIKVHTNSSLSNQARAKFK